MVRDITRYYRLICYWMPYRVHGFVPSVMFKRFSYNIAYVFSFNWMWLELKFTKYR